ncbi:MAG: tetratricopeptide repeat protein [Myxococcota bacterium]
MTRALAGLLLVVATTRADALDAARALRRVGRYADAQAAARKQAGGKLADDAETLIGEIARETGRYAEAEKVLGGVVARSPRHRRARIYLALVLIATGREAEARSLLHALYDDFDAGRIDPHSAADLTYVAMAARAAGGFQDASDTLRDATRADPSFFQAQLEWGDLFLEKYAAGPAEPSFAAVLAKDPQNPDALVGMARVKLEQSYDAAAAEDHLTRALRVNPRHADAHALRAAIALDAEDHPAAAAAAREALAAHVGHVGARVVLGASAWLRGDRAGYEAERAAALRVNPRESAFDHGVAEAITKLARYGDAITLEERALALRPDDPYALAGLGTNRLRMGDEEAGLAKLRAAWERDRFNARTYNVLELFEKIIPRDYVFATSEHFRLRLPKAREAGLVRPILDHLERAYAHYAKRYGTQPKGPIIVELFDDPAHYAVRTVGLPGLGALGVCFGRVVTSTTPSGKINWAQVLWHELSHVFTIGMSGARVPRWLTEGIADHETTLARPEWRRRSARELHAALARAPMPSIVDMHRAFVRARGMQEIVLAYYYSEQAVDFLERRFGLAKMLALVREFDEGFDAPAALRRVTGMDAFAIDRELRADLAQRLAVYDGQVDPKDDDAAVVAMRKRDFAAARARLDALLALGKDGFTARMLSGRAADELGDAAAAQAHFEAAARFDPEAVEPLLELARLHERAHRGDAALDALRKAGAMAGMELDVQKKLLALVAKRGLKQEACVVAKRVLNLDPEDEDALAAVK